MPGMEMISQNSSSQITKLMEAKKPKKPNACQNFIATLSRPFVAVYNQILFTVQGRMPNIPHLSGEFFSGRATWMQPPHFKAELGRLNEAAMKHPSQMCTFTIYTQSLVYIGKAKLAKEILTEFDQCVDRKSTLKPFGVVFNREGTNVFFLSNHVDKTKDYKAWLDQRTILEKRLFEKEALEKLIIPMQQVLVEQIAKFPERERIDLKLQSTILAISIVGHLLFNVSTDPKAVPEISEAFTNSFLEILRGSTYIKLVLRDFLALFNINYKIPIDDIEQELFKVVEKYLMNATKTNAEEKSTPENNLVLQILKYNKKPLDSKHIIEEGKFLILASHETTAKLMQFTLALLAKHPEVLKKLRESIKPPTNGKYYTLAELKGMTYLSQVIYETLRIFPPVPMISREVTKEFKAGKAPFETTFKKGQILMLSPPYLHRSADSYVNNDPEKFNPDRFDGQTLPPKDFFGFGAGPRHCPGQRFSIQETQLLLLELIPKYDFEVDNKPLRTEFCGTLQLQDDIGIKFKKRVDEEKRDVMKFKC